MKTIRIGLFFTTAAALSCAAQPEVVDQFGGTFGGTSALPGVSAEIAEWLPSQYPHTLDGAYTGYIPGALFALEWSDVPSLPIDHGDISGGFPHRRLRANISGSEFHAIAEASLPESDSMVQGTLFTLQTSDSSAQIFCNQGPDDSRALAVGQAAEAASGQHPAPGRGGSQDQALCEFTLGGISNSVGVLAECLTRSCDPSFGTLHATSEGSLTFPIDATPNSPAIWAAIPHRVRPGARIALAGRALGGIELATDREISFQVEGGEGDRAWIRLPEDLAPGLLALRLQSADAPRCEATQDDSSCAVTLTVSEQGSAHSSFATAVSTESPAGLDGNSTPPPHPSFIASQATIGTHWAVTAAIDNELDVVRLLFEWVGPVDCAPWLSGEPSMNATIALESPRGAPANLPADWAHLGQGEGWALPGARLQLEQIIPTPSQIETLRWAGGCDRETSTGTEREAEGFELVSIGYHAAATRTTEAPVVTSVQRFPAITGSLLVLHGIQFGESGTIEVQQGAAFTPLPLARWDPNTAVALMSDGELSNDSVTLRLRRSDGETHDILLP